MMDEHDYIHKANVLEDASNLSMKNFLFGKNLLSKSKAYSEPCQASKMECFAKTVKDCS